MKQFCLVGAVASDWENRAVVVHPFCSGGWRPSEGEGRTPVPDHTRAPPTRHRSALARATGPEPASIQCWHRFVRSNEPRSSAWDSKADEAAPRYPIRHSSNGPEEGCQAVSRADPAKAYFDSARATGGTIRTYSTSLSLSSCWDHRFRPGKNRSNRSTDAEIGRSVPKTVPSLKNGREDGPNPDDRESAHRGAVTSEPGCRAVPVFGLGLKAPESYSLADTLFVFW